MFTRILHSTHTLDIITVATDQHGNVVLVPVGHAYHVHGYFDIYPFFHPPGAPPSEYTETEFEERQISQIRMKALLSSISVWIFLLVQLDVVIVGSVYLVALGQLLDELPVI